MFSYQHDTQISYVVHNYDNIEMNQELTKHKRITRAQIDDAIFRYIVARYNILSHDSALL